MWNIFKSKTAYPPQVIPPKVLEIINNVDNALHETSIKNDCDLAIIERQIGIIDQFKSVDAISKEVLKNITGYYMPRSIAFYIDPNGTWVFLIGIRCNIINTTNTGLWLDALSRTNNARTTWTYDSATQTNMSRSI